MTYYNSIRGNGCDRGFNNINNSGGYVKNRSFVPRFQFPSQQQGFQNDQYGSQSQRQRKPIKESAILAPLEITASAIELNQMQEITSVQDPQPAVPSSIDPKAKVNEKGGMKKQLIRGKISKKKLQLNKRFRKMLMPKNALMVLNELLIDKELAFIEKSDVCPNTFVASVTIDGVEHIGYDKSKIGAKNAAAENALRHIVLTKIAGYKTSVASASAGNHIEDNSKMDVHGEEPNENEDYLLPIANFAVYKLLLNWYTDIEYASIQDEFMDSSDMDDMNSQLKDTSQTLHNVARVVKRRRPAKHLPNEPHLLNPVMLLNQVRDDVVYEEGVRRNGHLSNLIYSCKVILNGWEFVGRGSNKKSARRNCAYAACKKIYNITYPTDEYDPTTTSCYPVEYNDEDSFAMEN